MEMQSVRGWRVHFLHLLPSQPVGWVMRGVGALGHGSGPPGLEPDSLTMGTVPLAVVALRLLVVVWGPWTSATEARTEGHGHDWDELGDPFEDSLKDPGETFRGRAECLHSPRASESL